MAGLAAYSARWLVPGAGLVPVLTRWDAGFYLAIAADGYPRELSPVHGFFPLFPLVVRAVPGLADPTAAILVNTVAAAVAAVLVWRMAADVLGRETADRGAFLVCFFPGTYAWSFAYTEGLFVAFTAGCLLLLHRKRFWTAALVAGIGGAARPTGFALALACAFAVFVHWRETRDWKPLPSPLLAAGGYLAFLAYLAVRTGDPFASQAAQARWWGQGFDFGAATVALVVDVITFSTGDVDAFVRVAVVLAVVALTVNLVRVGVPGTWLVVVAATLVPALLSPAARMAPRYLLSAFPLLLGLAHVVRGNVYALTLALFAGALAVFILVMATTTAIVP